MCFFYCEPVLAKPSWLHTTWASVLSQESSQTVPQAPLRQISTRPSVPFLAPDNRMSPSVQAIEIKRAKIQSFCIVKRRLLTGATDNSSIFTMWAVMASNSISCTLQQSLLSPSASHIIEPNRTTAPSKTGTTSAAGTCCSVCMVHCVYKCCN